MRRAVKPNANSQDPDEPAHPCSLIKVFDIYYMSTVSFCISVPRTQKGLTKNYINALSLRCSIFLKNRHVLIQESFNKLIYSINTIITCGI